MKYYTFSILVLLFLAAGAANAQTDTGFVYQKPLVDFDYTRPVFKLQNEQLSNKNKFLRFSALSGYREGVMPVSAGFGTNFKRYDDPSTGTARIAMYNLSIVDMLYHFSLTGPMTKIYVILEVKDPSKYMYRPEYGDKETWIRKNAYCYEYAMPAALITGMSQFENELAYLFGVKVSREKRMATDTERYGLDPKEGNKEVSVFVVREINN